MHFAYAEGRPILASMTTSVLKRPAADAPAPGGAGGRRDRYAGVALMLVSGLSNQVGAATGALAFPVIGPAGVVAVRQWVAGALLWVVSLCLAGYWFGNLPAVKENLTVVILVIVAVSISPGVIAWLRSRLVQRHG